QKDERRRVPAKAWSLRSVFAGAGTERARSGAIKRDGDGSGVGGTTGNGTVDTLEEESQVKGVTNFQRPEDGAWDPRDPSQGGQLTLRSAARSAPRTTRRPPVPKAQACPDRRCSTTSPSTTAARSCYSKTFATRHTSAGYSCTTSPAAASSSWPSTTPTGSL